eukprot:2813931-Pyramimonas_sp.AAC.1
MGASRPGCGGLLDEGGSLAYGHSLEAAGPRIFSISAIGNRLARSPVCSSILSAQVRVGVRAQHGRSHVQVYSTASGHGSRQQHGDF